MNYRHAFHAGNFADVMKHAAIALAVESLKRKDKPFFVLDTHAGLGFYDLASEQAGKTGEYLGGIARVLEQPSPPEALSPYVDLVRRFNADGGLRWYPGSPELVRQLLRPDDRLALVELHPRDVEVLKQRFAGDRRVGVHHMDGYVAVKGLLPPPERRGLVLMDPPFEVKDELDRLMVALRRIRRLWPTGQVMVWYPIKGREPVRRFHQAIRDEGGGQDPGGRSADPSRRQSVPAERQRAVADQPTLAHGRGLGRNPGLAGGPPGSRLRQLEAGMADRRPGGNA